MRTLKKLFDNNIKSVEKIKSYDPHFFTKLANPQQPEYLWIGCSDSRVSANDIVDLKPGEMFIHRNIANVVVHTDLNCLSVIQYAVDVLKVKHIIVCGHYGCGGVNAAMGEEDHGLMENWLRHIKDVYRLHKEQIDILTTEVERFNLLCELNVKEQVANVCHTSIVQDAWKSGQELCVHGWIYSISDGILKDLNLCFAGMNEAASIYRV